MLVIPLLLAAIGPDPSIRSEPAKVEEPSEWLFSFRLSAGGEWDTNATRTIKGIGNVAADGLIRLVVDTRVRFDPAPGHQMVASYLLGAKRFFSVESEDLLVHNLSLSSAHALTDWLVASIAGAGKMSRIRNKARDYNLGYGEAALTVRPISQIDIEAHGGITGFTYPTEPDYDYYGPRVGGLLIYRPVRGLSLYGGFDWVWRRYDGNRTYRQPNNELCTPDKQEDGECPSDGKRRDTEAQVSINAIYRSTFIVGGGYQVRLQRSNSDLEQVDRHRVSAFGTVALPFDLTLNLLAALQINNGVSITDTLFLAEDDENQNSVQAGISYRIAGELVAELRYALYANQFATNDVSFLRHTVYLGLGYRVGQ